ncbi:uncharacterized protein LOC108676457 [Hyalella azteca]|uniref:Uncharacterized protein LOC108676457 n=1 Tax=Hyalella azteca TaxID=294128 RepID=A0A8B7P1W6_HYAAZ|nr:uncharacterized protein LOC108676457 [Hyalella azteca]
MNRWQKAVRKLQLVKWDELMLRPARYEICFDAPGDVYFAEEMVTGHVLLEMKQPVNLKGVKLRFKGECLVHFTESPLILTSERPRKSSTYKKRWSKGASKGPSLEDDDIASDHKLMRQLRTRKPNGVSPLLTSPYRGSTHEKIKLQACGVMNGKINKGYVPDSAETTSTETDWTRDRRNGGTVQTPPDKSPPHHQTKLREGPSPQNSESHDPHNEFSPRHRTNLRKEPSPPSTEDPHREPSQSNTDDPHEEAISPIEENVHDESSQREGVKLIPSENSEPTSIAFSFRSASTMERRKRFTKVPIKSAVYSAKNLEGKEECNSRKRLSSRRRETRGEGTEGSQEAVHKSDDVNKQIDNHAVENNEGSKIVVGSGGFSRTAKSLSTSSTPSEKSQASLRQSNEASSLESDLEPDDSKPVFTIDRVISYGQNFVKPYLAPGRNVKKDSTFSSKKSNRRKGEFGRPKSSCSVVRENTLRGPTYHYRAIETYFDCEFYIYGHKYQKAENEMLAPGVYQFPFAFNLPPNLPPSFASEKGVIRYVVAAILDRPAAANLVRRKAFNILSILDLNMDSHASSSISRSKIVNPCGLFCHSGPITLSVRIPKSGYVSGEKILVSAEADNISGRSTKRTRLMLLQVITYIMPNKIKTHVERRIVKEIVRGMIPPGESDIWEKVALHVPPLAPANLHISGRLMRVDYCVEMVLELHQPWKPLRVSLPIKLGSVPLTANFADFLPPPPAAKQPSLPKITYKNLPLFSYAECFFGRESLEGQYERLTGEVEDLGPQFESVHPFAPSFVTYKFGSMANSNTKSEEHYELRPNERVSGNGLRSMGSKESQASNDSEMSVQLDSKKEMEMSAIMMMNSQSMKSRTEWLNNRQAGGMENKTHNLNHGKTHDPLDNATREEEPAILDDYDFDKDESRDEESDPSSTMPKQRWNIVTSTKFAAMKIISNGKFDSPQDFITDDASLATP